MILSVTYAVTSVSPRALLVNKRTRLEIPGAVPGDHVRLVRVAAATRAATRPTR